MTYVKINKGDTKIWCAFDFNAENFDFQYVAFNGASLMSLQEKKKKLQLVTLAVSELINLGYRHENHK